MTLPELNSLREALSVSPENLALRLTVASSMLDLRLFAEAETEYKLIFVFSPGNLSAKEGLAKAFYKQDKFSAAEVLYEEICIESAAQADSHLYYARLLMKDSMTEKAMEQYQIAKSKDQALSDEQFEEPNKPQKKQKISYEYNGGTSFDIEPAPFPKISFKDVGGMEDVKEEVRMKIIYPMTHQDLFKSYGKKSGGGILLYGPPGCGKTFLAKATAGEAKARFINVGINDILDKYVGGSEHNIHKIFELARENKPCILFFDEVDALGHDRERTSAIYSQAINQFLSELDGVEGNNEGILIMAATNAPWRLDAAFKRPGRFDELIFVKPPDTHAREEILNIHLKGKPCSDLDIKELAKKTMNFSGADIRGLVDHVIEQKLRLAFKSGNVEHLNHSDLLRAANETIPTTKEWFATARNYALYANDSGLYTGILDYLNKNRNV